MALILRHQTPYFIERGFANTLTADVYDTDDNSQKTATAGTISIYHGSSLIVDSADITGVGPPATYTLPAATIPAPPAAADDVVADARPVTTSSSPVALGTDWYVIWSLTGNAAGAHRRRAHMCRYVPRPVIIDTDLTYYMSDIAALRDSDQSTYTLQRAEAWVQVETRLMKLGRRPELVLDEADLRMLHIYETMVILCRDFASSTGDGRYRELQEEYRRLADEEITGGEGKPPLSYHYDSDEVGVIQPEDIRSTAGVLYTSRPPRDY